MNANETPLEVYMQQVQTHLAREGQNTGLDDADSAVVVLGLSMGVGPGDCAAQITANRFDAQEA